MLMKTPEQYFAEQDFSSVGAESTEFSPSEKAFIEKYMGEHAPEILQEMRLDSGKLQSRAVSGRQSGAEEISEDTARSEPDIYVGLRDAPELLMVGFYLGKQEFVLPTAVVQEVIRSMPVAKLPASPPLIAGVINLRGKVTPLIRLRDALEVASARESQDNFIIVCKQKGLQIGLMIERIHTMYRVVQEKIDWNIDMHLGVNIDLVAGVVKFDDQLVSIIHVDKIIDSILA